MTRCRLAFVTSLAVACATPTSGAYVLVDVAIVSTDCPEDTEAAEEDPIAITVSEDKATVTFYEDPADVDLPLEGPRFAGVLGHYVTDYNTEEGGVDAVATWHSEIAGKWVADDTIAGTRIRSNTCEGTYCAELVALDAVYCSTTSEYEGFLVAE